MHIWPTLHSIGRYYTFSFLLLCSVILYWLLFRRRFLPETELLLYGVFPIFPCRIGRNRNAKKCGGWLKKDLDTIRRKVLKSRIDEGEEEHRQRGDAIAGYEKWGRDGFLLCVEKYKTSSIRQ